MLSTVSYTHLDVYKRQCIGGVLRAQDDLSEAGYFHLNRLPEMAFKNDVKVIKKLKLRLIDNDKR